MSKKHNKLYLLAPLLYPAIGFLVCVSTLCVVLGPQEIGEWMVVTLSFGVLGLLPITLIAGVVVASLELFLHRIKKTLAMIFAILAAGSAFLGWVFAQSILYF